VAGVELIPLAELQRPRIDVTTRISGFFRDAFPQLIELIDDAVQLAIAADEPEHLNFVRKHYARLQQGLQAGLGQAEAAARRPAASSAPSPAATAPASCPDPGKELAGPGRLRRGLHQLGRLAYGRKVQGADQREAFRQRLSGVQVACTTRTIANTTSSTATTTCSTTAA
jgi:cobaltochelatase CobN